MSGLRIDLDDAGAGMVLAEALTDGHGTVLLPEGAVLSDSMLASLRRRGVESCTIIAPADGGDGDGGAAEDPALARARALERLQHLLRRSAETDATGQLLQLLATYRAGS